MYCKFYIILLLQISSSIIKEFNNDIAMKIINKV